MGCGDPSCRDPNCTYGREVGPGAPRTVAWRYQRKEGWGDIWRVADILPTFETPEHWTVEALGVIGAVEPAPTGEMVRHDIEADRGLIDIWGLDGRLEPKPK